MAGEERHYNPHRERRTAGLSKVPMVLNFTVG
jgi:hypothetical protein